MRTQTVAGRCRYSFDPLYHQLIVNHEKSLLLKEEIVKQKDLINLLFLL